MIFSRTAFISLLGLVATTAAQQSSSSVVCIAGQCVQGFSNTTIGSKLTAPGSSTSLHLLPGQYTSTTNPQLLHNLLTTSSASLASSAGLSANGPITSLPLDLALQPGLAIYSESLYAGQDAFSGLPTTPVNNISLPIGAKSIALSDNVWVAVSSNNNDGRTILWDSVPDVSQISLSSSLTLLDIQSTSCSPSCSGAGICSAAGQCVCPSNFAGSSCESCAAGHFGAQCQPCPDGCDKCDEGIAGTGRCLTPQVGPTDPKRCNCVNGECNTDGTCTCSNGWVDRSDGTKCASCAAGFFLTSTGDCSACQLGCVQCSETTGTCNACKTGFTQNLQDRTKCDPVQAVLSTGAFCPPGSFSDGARCVECSNLCETCTAAGDGDCLTCAAGLYMFNGRCVQADTNGICSGSNGLVADNIKRVCDTCPNKCSSCRIPSFSRASTIGELQCTECLPGSFLLNGKCVDTCPTGTFVNPQDNRSCTPCSSSCGTCAGSADFCLTCTGNLFASDGKCVSTCPSGTFTSTTSETNTPANTCLKCHPDCPTCSGPSFNQCLTCSTSRPVLSTVTGATSGRCLPTCSKTQYFDATTRTCQSCDGNCASCSGPGASRCLSCQNSRQIVKGGQCVDASCSSGTGVIPGLGVCLSDLVVVPTTTDGAPPLPTITGLGDPTKVESRKKLEWWQILLMALGCAFIFVVFLWCCRRRARKQRAKKTALFAKGKGIQKGSWNWARFTAGWKLLFSRNKNKSRGATTNGEGELPIAYNHHEVTSRGLGGPISMRAGEDIKMSTLNTGNGSSKDAQARLGRSDSRKSTVNKNNRKPHDNDDLESYIDAYDYSRRSLSIHSRTPSTLPDLDGYYPSRSRNRDYDRDRLRREVIGAKARDRNLERDSMFSEMTGMSRNTPEPRMPVRRDAVPIGYTDSSNSNSRAGSPVRDAGKLRKLQLERKASDETMSSVVIKPQASKGPDAMLIDLGEGAQHKDLPQPPLQYQPSPFLSSIPVQTPASTGLTAAQMYAMTTRPELIGGGIGAQSTVLPQTQVSSMPMVLTGATPPSLPMPTGVGLGITTTGGSSLGGPIGTTGGLYWLEPAAGSTNNFVLKPAMTGSSTLTGNSQVSAKNPFRQGSY